MLCHAPPPNQSLFAAHLLRHFHSQGCTVVYEDAKRKSRWLLTPGAPVQEGAMDQFSEQLKQAATVYICDVGGRGSREPTVCDALTIVLSSPDASHYHEWIKLKRKPTVHMPSWSLGEVTAVVPTVYPERFLPDGVTSIYPGRFQLYGGIARTIFSPDDDERLEKELTSAIESCHLDALLHSLMTGTRLGPLQQLVHFVVGSRADGSPDFRTASLDFASDAICERVMREKETREGHEIVSFLRSAAGKPDVASMRGKAFEHWAHRVLAAGGDFRARWEQDASHKDIQIRFAPSTQRGVVGDLAVLASGVSQLQPLHWDASMGPARSRGVCAAHALCICVLLRCARPQEYARLLQANYKTIDSARFPKHLFQMTVSPTHSLNLAGLQAAMSGLGRAAGPQPCLFYFVVPPDVYPTYRHLPAAIVPAGAQLPANVALLVLEIPLPEHMPAAAAGASSSTAAAAAGAAATPATAAAARAKRTQRPEDADLLLPPAKKATAAACNCTTGCTSGRCRCFLNKNKCGAACHTAAAPASAAACSNC